MMNVLYLLFSAVIVVVSVTALLINKLDCKKILILIGYMFAMSYIGLQIGQIAGVPMIVWLVILIMSFSKEYRLENACLACVGYLININCNNALCLMIVAAFQIPLAEFESRYWFPFCAFYLILLLVMMKVLRYLLYEKIDLKKYLDSISKPIRNGLFANMFLYVIIFFVNLWFGQRAGYSSKALLLNFVLFAVCMIVSGLLILACASSIKSAEQKKADAKQKEITENYINSMEKVLEELRAFKHDYKNIMAEMAAYIREGQIEQLKAYYYKLTQAEEIDKYKDLHVWKSLRNIQPMELKGLLYEKVLSLLSKNINLDIKIETDLYVRYKDMQVINRILGIFIDNALEAAIESVEKKIIIEVKTIENGVSFTIANTCKELPNLAKMFQKGYTTKGKGRGMGLYWVQCILKEKEELIHETNLKSNMIFQKIDIPN